MHFDRSLTLVHQHFKTMAKKIKLRSSTYFELLPEHKETPGGVSLTVPNQSVSLAELLRRHQAGIAPDVSQQPFYEENSSFDSADYTKINSLDLYEKEEIKQALNTNINQMKESLRKSKEKTPVKNDRPEPTEEPETKPAKKGKKPPENNDED